MPLKKVRIYLTPTGVVNCDGRFYRITKAVNTIKYQVGDTVSHAFVEKMCLHRDCEVVISIEKGK